MMWHKKVQRDVWSLWYDSPNELWKAYILKFLDSYSYFSFSIIFTLFLSNDFHYSDIVAGTFYGAWGALITIYGLLTGSLVDNLGVAKSLRLGFILSLLARIGIFWTTSRVFLLFHICFLLPLANCLGIPVLTTGIRRYTQQKHRGFAFGLFYVVMNVAALLSGPVVDILTIGYDDNEDQDQDYDAAGDATTAKTAVWRLTSYRAIILTGIVANVLACIVAFTVREIKVDDHDSDNDDNSSADSSNKYQDDGRVAAPSSCCNDVDNASNQGNNNIIRSKTNVPITIAMTPKSGRGIVTAFQPTRTAPIQIWKETLQTKSFWRFLVVCILTLNVRMIFRHLDATLPKFMVREFGSSVPKGTIYSINPAIIIFLVPIVTAITTNIDPLLMIHHGSYISAASVFFLVLSTSIPACVLFVIVLSIGESIWSPRLYDYTMSVVQEGREGTYMALSSAPLFLAKLPVGFMSGYLLQKYCPKDGERQSWIMWLIIGLTTASSPILMTIFWKYISKKDGNNTKYTELLEMDENNSNTVLAPQNNSSVVAVPGNGLDTQTPSPSAVMA